jgi:hypothetical protein
MYCTIAGPDLQTKSPRRTQKGTAGQLHRYLIIFIKMLGSRFPMSNGFQFVVDFNLVLVNQPQHLKHAAEIVPQLLFLREFPQIRKFQPHDFFVGHILVVHFHFTPSFEQWLKLFPHFHRVEYHADSIMVGQYFHRVPFHVEADIEIFVWV